MALRLESSFPIRMIKSFKHKGLKDFFEKGDHSGLNPHHVKRLRLLLAKIHTAHEIKDVNFPGSGLHQLRHNRKGQWALTVKKNWRVTFVFENGHMEDLNIEDYH